MLIESAGKALCTFVLFPFQEVFYRNGRKESATSATIGCKY